MDFYFVAREKIMPLCEIDLFIPQFLIYREWYG